MAGYSAKLIRLLRNIYSSAHFKLRRNNRTFQNFNINEGVLQGELLSPLLFLNVIADLETFLRENKCEGTNIDGLMDIPLLLYADDFAGLVSC